MTKNTVELPLGDYLHPLTGQPVALGKVYVGTADTDPTVEVNRINVTIVQEGGNVTVLPASQPFILSSGGKITYLGSPARITVDVDYSITVTDADDVVLYAIPNSAEELAGNIISVDADAVVYDNAFSGMSAVNVQDAIDEIADLLFNEIYAIGSYYIGVDPNLRLRGTWVQIADGAFLMNTSSGDLTGGTNSLTLDPANVPAHTHPMPHKHLMAVNSSSGNGQPPVTADSYMAQDGGATSSNREYNLTKPTSALAEPDVALTGDTETADTEANAPAIAFDNRPLYVGVAIWERTA